MQMVTISWYWIFVYQSQRGNVIQHKNSFGYRTKYNKVDLLYKLGKTISMLFGRDENAICREVILSWAAKSNDMHIVRCKHICNRILQNSFSCDEFSFLCQIMHADIHAVIDRKHLNKNILNICRVENIIK